jgi:hypothetical protein
MVLKATRLFRLPEPLRRADQLSRILEKSFRERNKR